MKTHQERSEYCQNPTAKQLFVLMENKQSNLCVSPDFTTCAAILDIAEKVGPYICVFKLHVDIINDFTPAFITSLQKLSQQHHFLIFEDRKFADIGNTVQLQYAEGIYHIADWAHITNAHPLPGPGIIEGLKAIGLPKGNGLLLLAEMSSKGNFITHEYTQQNLQLARANPDFVIGFVSQHRLTDEPNFIHFTPGIQLQEGGDALGQQYNTPKTAIIDNEVDIIIVGRGIYKASDPTTQAKIYQEAGWQAYQQRLQQNR